MEDVDETKLDKIQIIIGMMRRYWSIMMAASIFATIALTYSHFELPLQTPLQSKFPHPLTSHADDKTMLQLNNLEGAISCCLAIKQHWQNESDRKKE